ncbi:MAG: hypothetical protein AAB255_00805 [Bacteroidota bacterium]
MKIKFLTLVLLFSFISNAQLNKIIKNISSLSAKENNSLQISVNLQRRVNINSSFLFYRQFGESRFKKIELTLSQDSIFAIIPGKEVIPPFIEVYATVILNNGQTESYPFNNPETTPFKIQVNPKNDFDNSIVFLSPEKDEKVSAEDLFISFSSVYTPQSINKKRTEVFINNINFTKYLIITGDLVILNNIDEFNKLNNGLNLIKVRLYSNNGKLISSVEHTFFKITTEQAVSEKSKINFGLSAQIESRKEIIKNNTTNYNIFDLKGNVEYGFLKSNTNIYLTSQENQFVQPQNRMLLGLNTNYLKLKFGDIYPNYSRTILDGRRVRGIAGDLMFGYINFQGIQGEVTRKIISNDSSKEIKSLQKNISAGRLSFGKGDNFQFGLSILKSRDVWDSTLGIKLKPQENLVIGPDLIIGIDNKHIEFTTQASFSINNFDYSTEAFTEATIDTFVSKGGIDKASGDQLKSMLPILSPFITINENLQASMNPDNLLKSPGLAYESALTFNYFNNFIRASYIFHGKDYQSTGTTSLRKDIQGLNLSDRIRLLDNKIFISASYEALTNNTSEKEITTTNYKNTNASLSLYPGMNLPNITLGTTIGNNFNSLNPLDSVFGSRAVNEKTNRIFLQTNYDVKVFGQHNFSLSLDQSKKDDILPRNQDVTSTNTFFMINSAFPFLLESAFGFMNSNNKIPSIGIDTITNQPILKTRTMKYTTISLNTKLKLFSNMLHISTTLAPTSGDFSRTMFDVNLQFFPIENLSTSLQLQILQNELSDGTKSNDKFISLMLRYDL